MTEKAWMTFMPDGTDDDVWYTNPEGKLPEGYTYQRLNPNWSLEQDLDAPLMLNGVPLYPRRTWVGLTDEDNIDWEEGGNLKDLVKAIEAKLKEKNT